MRGPTQAVPSGFRCGARSARDSPPTRLVAQRGGLSYSAQPSLFAASNGKCIRRTSLMPGVVRQCDDKENKAAGVGFAHERC